MYVVWNNLPASVIIKLHVLNTKANNDLVYIVYMFISCLLACRSNN